MTNMTTATSLPSEQDLIYDWNTRRRRHKLSQGKIELFDETLRDGLEGPSVVDPTIEQKMRIVDYAAALGIHCMNIGHPSASERSEEHSLALARHIVERGLALRPACSARTRVEDIRPIAEISQRVGRPIEVMAFLGASPIRSYVENWTVERLLQRTRAAISEAVREGLPTTFVVEDTTRSLPATLDAIFRAAIDCGAKRICLCDTAGHATPDGVKNLIEFTRNVVESTGAKVGIDWHGHNDRGLALTNTLSAIEYGASRVHGTALGLGERVGNAPLDLILVNLRLLGELDNDVSSLAEWCGAVSEATGAPIAHNYPLLGHDAFRTATGVHAAAILKASRKGDHWLADRVQCGVPAALVGRQQVVAIGPMSGHSNVICWLNRNGYPVGRALCEYVLAAAKTSSAMLTDREIETLVREHIAKYGEETSS